MAIVDVTAIIHLLQYATELVLTSYCVYQPLDSLFKTTLFYIFAHFSVILSISIMAGIMLAAVQDAEMRETWSLCSHCLHFVLIPVDFNASLDLPSSLFNFAFQKASINN